MELEERLAWLIDPEAFSRGTLAWERKNPNAVSPWGSRRTTAHKKARVIIAFMKEES